VICPIIIAVKDDAAATSIVTPMTFVMATYRVKTVPSFSGSPLLTRNNSQDIKH
jgi:hypothetical protein